MVLAREDEHRGHVDFNMDIGRAIHYELTAETMQTFDIDLERAIHHELTAETM